MCIRGKSLKGGPSAPTHCQRFCVASADVFVSAERQSHKHKSLLVGLQMLLSISQLGSSDLEPNFPFPYWVYKSSHLFL